MNNWLISANPNVYNHSSSFEHYGFIDWTQKRIKYAVGDIVYIYCTRPLQMVQYKCIVEKLNVSSQEMRDDKEYWTDLGKYTNSLNGKFMRLKLVEQVSSDKLNLKNLLQNGLKSAPQSPMKISDPNLLNYLETYFTDNLQADYFPDTLDENDLNNEGLRKKVLVNKYERSSKAREEAVKYHGLRCCVCKMKFEERYGEVGEKFIHIHHLIPISEIGKDYKINYKDDLIPVCPNCHSMLHRKINGKYPTVQELKLMIQK